MHLENRRNYLALRYCYRVKGHLDNPANKYFIPLSYRTLFLNKNIPLPLSLRVQSLLETYKLRKNFIKPHFSYKILEIAHVGIESAGYKFSANTVSKIVNSPYSLQTRIPSVMHGMNSTEIMKEVLQTCLSKTEE